MNCALNRLIVALSIACTPLSSYATNSCGAKYAQIINSDSFYRNIHARIEDSWHGLAWQRFERQALPANTLTPIELGNELEKLTTQERLLLLNHIKKNPPPYHAQEIARYLLLALGDEPTWDRLLHQAAKEGGDRILYNYLSPHLMSMPSERRMLLLKKINTFYPEARGLKDGIPRGFAPKRALDFLIRHMLPPEKTIAEEIKNGATATHAWNRYLQEVRRILPQAQTTPYGAEEVLDYAQRIQNVLKEKNWNTSIMIGGSLPSGKAAPVVSDVDLFSYPYQGLKEHIPELDELFEKGPLGGLKPGLKFVHPENITSFSRLSPIFVKVSQDKIELVVYPAIRPLTVPDLMKWRYPTRIETVYPLP